MLTFTTTNCDNGKSYTFRSVCSKTDRGIFNTFKKHWAEIRDAIEICFGDATLKVLADDGKCLCDGKIRFNIFASYVDTDFHYHYPAI